MQVSTQYVTRQL